jgi:hypothetical protein
MDPQTEQEWDAVEVHTQQVVKDMMNYLQSVRTQPGLSDMALLSTYSRLQQFGNQYRKK